MSKINSTSRLMELMPQAIVVVDIQSNEVVFSNKVAKDLFSFDKNINKLTDILMHTTSSQSIYTAVRKELQNKETSVINHVYVETALGKSSLYDIHVSYVDETHQSVYLIFAISSHELERMTQQNDYYNAISDVSYSYPFHLDIKTKRMEFFNPSLTTEYHIPLIMDNFPEPLFDYNYIYEDDIDEYKSAINRMYRGESPKGSFRFYDIKGGLVRYSLNYVVNRDEYGQPIDANGDFVIQSPVKEALEYKEKLQKSAHECIDILFTVGATSKDPNVAYTAVLKEVKDYYKADGAYFYKFIDKTNKVERVHVEFNDNLKNLDQALPMVVNEEQIKMMQLLADAKISDIQNQLNSLEEPYIALKKQQEEFNINSFGCVAIKSVSGDIMGFLGVINSKIYQDNKELMELISRPICMFIDFQKEQQMKQELLKLEANSKANVVKECVDNFREFTNHKSHITAVLNALCCHYDADFSAVLTSNSDKNGDYEISYMGGTNIPNLEGLENQPASAMEKWRIIFQQHKHYITDIDIDSPFAKKLLKEKFGVYNFIASPIQDENGELTGLLYVMNYKTLDRSNLLTHIVANNISTYLDKINLYTQKHLEPLTKLTDKIETQNQITEYLEDGTKGALFIIDIDHFKNLNDTFGHHFGDKAIINLANIIKESFRNSDVIGRIGGDEFMVFSPNLMSDDLIEIKAKQLIENCNLKYEKDGLTAKITTSIGICRVTDDCNTFQSLYEKADEVLYVSKKNGKNQYNIYNKELTEAT